MKNIGEILRNKREQLGMTLVELEEKTKIQRQFLVMIEKMILKIYQIQIIREALLQNMLHLLI